MSRTLMPSVSSPNPDVKKIRLYRNGDANFNGKDLVFNRRQVKTIDRLLQTVTEHVDLDRAARSIHTPIHGTAVKSLDEITDKQSYVIVGQGSKFRHLNYGMLDGRYGSRTLDRKKAAAEVETIKVVEHSPIRVPGRMHQAIVDVIPIYVYCNGNDQEPPKRILLTENMFRQQNARRSWEMILAEISRFVQPQFTATTQLYTLDGTPLRHRSEIAAGKEYVAVSYRAPFRHMNYVLAGSKPAFNVSPRIVRRYPSNGTEQYYRQYRPARTNYSSDEDSLSYLDSSSMPPRSTQSDPVIQKNRPYRYHYKVVYTDGRSVFPAKATARPFKYQEPLPAIADDRGDEGVFKARTARVETYSAKEVDESGTKSERRYADNKKLRASRVDVENAREIDDNELAYERHIPYANTTRRYPQNNKTMSSRLEAAAENDDKPLYDGYRANPKTRSSRIEVTAENDDKPMYGGYRANPKPKTSRTEAESVNDVNENVQPAYVTRRTNPTVKNSRMETEEMTENNIDEPMSDNERQIHENNPRVLDNEGQETPEVDVDGDREPAADDTSARNKTPDQEYGQGVSDGQLSLDNERHEEPEVDVDGDREPAADDTSARNKTPDQEYGREQSVSESQAPDVEGRESSKAGESYRDNEEQNHIVEESEDNVNQQDADSGDQLEQREQGQEDAKVKDVDGDDGGQQDADRLEREAATKIQAAYKGYSDRKRLRQEKLQTDVRSETAAEATVEEETAAVVTDN